MRIAEGSHTTARFDASPIHLNMAAPSGDCKVSSDALTWALSMVNCVLEMATAELHE